jgi:hypothetical protein
MEDTKNILLSKTVWGVFLSIVGVILNAMGFDSTGLNGAEGDIVVLAGAALSFYGRITAVKKLK